VNWQQCDDTGVATSRGVVVSMIMARHTCGDWSAPPHLQPRGTSVPPPSSTSRKISHPSHFPTRVIEMPPSLCVLCTANRALLVRPKDHSKLCKSCFISTFETEIHHTITTNALFTRGEKIAIGASGGKDSTVLASVLKTLNERHDYGVELILLSIDEGIKGYRDDSLETVKRNATQYDMPLTILGYKELYDWTMDEVVEQVGKKGNCTYCGVFRRQALDRGAARLGVKHVVTGHNADDVAETVLMNCNSKSSLIGCSEHTDMISSTTRRPPSTFSHNLDHNLYPIRNCFSFLQHQHQTQQTPEICLRKRNRPLCIPQKPRLLQYRVPIFTRSLSRQRSHPDKESRAHTAQRNLRRYT
jgi:hypothetical protein